LKKSSRKTVNPRRRKQPTAVSGSVPGNSVFLVGFMGAGKSSVGRALGQRLNWLFEDLDDRIEAREGRKVAEIFADSGESEFRRAEHAALQQVLQELRGGGARIVALGGGTFAQEQNHKAIQASGIRTVFLDAPLDELWRRCAEQSDAKRPLMTSQNKFREAHRARLPYYQKASRRIDTLGKQVDAITAEIVQTLKLKEIALRTEQGEVE
jgi:shikimate kinase